MNQEQKRIIYKIDNNDDEFNILSDLKIIECLPIHDCKTDHKLVVNKLGIGDMGLKLFIETSYLKVLSIDEIKLCLKLPQSHIDFFDTMDDKCAELLGKMVNGETELDITELYGQIDLMGYNNIETFDIANVEYKSLIDTNSGIMKINIFSDTTIKHSGKNISSSKIKPGDDVRIVLGLDYISLLIDSSNLLARTKIYSYFIDVSKNYTYVPSSREKIDDWKFTSNKKTDIFIKTNITENDNFDVNTEIYNQTKSNNHIGGNLLNLINRSNVFNESSENNDLSSLNSSSIGKSLKHDNQNIDESDNLNVEEHDNQNVEEHDNQNIEESHNESLEANMMSLSLCEKIDDENNLNIAKKINETKSKNKTKVSKITKGTKGVKETKKQIINIDTNENNNDDIDINEKVVELENKKMRKPRTRVAKKITKEHEQQIEQQSGKKVKKQ